MPRVLRNCKHLHWLTGTDPVPFRPPKKGETTYDD